MRVSFASMPPRPVALGIGLGLTLVLAVSGFFAPRPVLHGWLVAFASLGGLSLGCVAWLAIHALTGGRWGEVGRPALLGGAATLPLTVLLVLPLVLADRWLYPWAADPGTSGPGVAALYLNTAGVAARSLLLLVGLSVVGWRAHRGALSPLLAALALLLYGGLMNLLAFDWLLSLDPHYTSSAFGMQMIVAQLLSGLCFAVLASDAPADNPVWGDFGGLMLACLLGEAYLLLMTLVVHWYGNLPDQAAWYLRRSLGVWRWLEVGGTLVGAIGPGCALLVGRVRHSRTAMRVVALAVLCGIVAEVVWLVLPEAGQDAGWALLAAIAALIALSALMAAVMSLRASGLRGERGVTHAG